MTRIAVVCLCTGDYWKGAKVLFHTLRKHGKLPEHVDCIALGMPDCDFATPTAIEQDYSWVPVSQKNFPRVADKFHALTLDYSRVILMDADMLCMGDCSYLWGDRIGKLPFYAARDCASVVYYHQEIQAIGLDENLLFNAGTMVFQLDQLSQDFYDRVIELILDGTLKSYDGGDQGYLNHYFQLQDTEIGYLPQEYNGCTDQYIPQLPDHAKRLVHFTGANLNPWSTTIPKSDRRRYLIDRWRAEWEECK